MTPRKFDEMIPSIPTKYNGIEFRSKLEANWAEWFDEYSIKWSYESEGFKPKGVWYLPDFHLPEINTFIEIKGALQGIPKARKFFDALMEINFNHALKEMIDNPEFGSVTVEYFRKNVESTVEWDAKYLYFLGGSPVPSIYRTNHSTDCRLFCCKKCGKYWIAFIEL